MSIVHHVQYGRGSVMCKTVFEGTREECTEVMKKNDLVTEKHDGCVVWYTVEGE